MIMVGKTYIVKTYIDNVIDELCLISCQYFKLIHSKHNYELATEIFPKKKFSHLRYKCVVIDNIENIFRINNM